MKNSDWRKAEMTQEHMPERIIQEQVPGKEITIAHLIASPDITLYEKLGLDPRVEHSKSAIGVLTISRRKLLSSQGILLSRLPVLSWDL